jgi:tetratricopeptide (TPR) repeat protein
MKHLPIPLVLCLALTAPLAAQQPAAQDPVAQDPVAQEPEPIDEITAAAQQAADLYREGKPTEAVAVLEPLAGRDDLPPQFLGLLGALYLDIDRPVDAMGILEPMATAEDANAAVLYNAGRAAMATGRFSDAETFLRRSLDLTPESPAARELGMLLGGQGRYEESFLLLRPWTRSDPEDEAARLIAALAAVQLDRPTDAEELLSDLSQDQPPVRLLWGKLLLLKGDPFGALSTLKPLLGNAPETMDVDIRRTLADAHASIGQAAEAVALLDGHIGGNPAIALQLGQAQYQSGDLDAAIATLGPFAGPVLDADGQGPNQSMAAALIVEYGRLLVTGGRHEEAVPYLELATRMTPGNKQSWLQSVQLERDLEDPTGRELREAMRLAAQNEFAEALNIVYREGALAPEDMRPMLVAGQVLLMATRTDEAARVADQLIQGAPGHPDAHYLRGIIRMAQQDLAGAEEDFRTTLGRAPEHTAALNDLAVLLIETGNESEARQLLERALEIRPDDETAAANLQRLEQG